MRPRKSLVTGGAGFIGSHLVDRLINRGDQVTVIDNFRTGRYEFVNSKAKLINHDIGDTKYLREYFENIDDVYHLAANADVRNGWMDSRRDFEFNLERTLCVAELSANAKVENFIFSSTGSIYGEAKTIPTTENYSIDHQTSLYAASKYSSESFLGAYAEANKFKVTVLRFVSILGPRYTHGHVYDFIRKLTEDPTSLSVLGDGNQTKSYLHVTDCVNALTNLRGRRGFEIFNIGQTDTLSVKRSIEIITKTLNLRPEISYQESRQGWIGDNPLILLDTTKAYSNGWSPTIPIEEAIRETARWILQNTWVLDVD
jgi:UDP-glucose 4-epimerase